MLKMLAAFAALSMCGTIILTLLPEGGIKRTASMAIGLITLLCWAEGIAALLKVHLSAAMPSTVLSATAYSIQTASSEAAADLSAQWEVLP